MEFEDILRDVGGYGKYQRDLSLLFLSPVTIFVPWFIMTNLFLVSVPDHWCYVPQLANSNLNISQQRRLVSPAGNSECLMYNISYENVSVLESEVVLDNDTNLIPCTNGWSFDQSNYESTAATKWNLVCDKSHYTSFVLTLQNVGGVIGSPIFSCFSDKYGRKVVYFVVTLVSITSNFLSPFAQDFSMFAVMRAIQGTCYPAILILPYILVVEIIPPEKRTLTSYVWNASWVFGMCILPLIVFLSRSWRILCWVNSAAGAVILLYWRFIPESPRWLISRKRYEEARDILLKMAEKNGQTTNTKNLLSNLQALGEKMELEEKGEKRQFYSIIKFPRLRRHFLMLTASCVGNITIYVLIHYNISNLEGNEFLIFFLLSVAEMPGVFLLWFLMERFGRRWSAAGSFIVSAIVCAIPLTGIRYSDIVSSVIAKFMVAGLFMVTDQQLCELYPTVVRSFAMSASKSIASGIAFCLPYIIYLSIYGKAIPFAVISFTCVLVGISASFLPETLNKNLPQTAADAEEFGKDQKYFSFKKAS